jgi:hypothetical protein
MSVPWRLPLSGHTVGMAEVIWLLRPALVPPRVTVMLLPEYENCRALTAVVPSVWLSWAVMERPG